VCPESCVILKLKKITVMHFHSPINKFLLAITLTYVHLL
jgi:hypothetical protein